MTTTIHDIVSGGRINRELFASYLAARVAAEAKAYRRPLTQAEIDYVNTAQYRQLIESCRLRIRLDRERAKVAALSPREREARQIECRIEVIDGGYHTAVEHKHYADERKGLVARLAALRAMQVKCMEAAE